MKKRRIATCRACNFYGAGGKSRNAITHTCGIENDSLETHLFNYFQDDEIEEEIEPTINHKWGSWEKIQVPEQLRMIGLTSEYNRTCKVCGANQHKKYFKNQKWPDVSIERNGREDVDCNPELNQSKA